MNQSDFNPRILLSYKKPRTKRQIKVGGALYVRDVNWLIKQRQDKEKKKNEKKAQQGFQKESLGSHPVPPAPTGDSPSPVRRRLPQWYDYQLDGYLECVERGAVIRVKKLLSPVTPIRFLLFDV